MSLHGWALFSSVFGVIFIAELPDKTALAALVLATRHRPFPVLAGAAAALAVQSLVAVGAGHLVSLLPERPVRLAAGVLFLMAAVLIGCRKEESDVHRVNGGSDGGFWRSASLVFAVVFVAEWGDLTQLATAALEARYSSPFIVFAGATAALWAVAALAVFVGHRAGERLDPVLTKRIGAVLLALVGAALLAGVL